MKNRKIWGLALILVVGMAVTLFTDRILKRELDAQLLADGAKVSVTMSAGPQEVPRSYGAVMPKENAAVRQAQTEETASSQKSEEERTEGAASKSAGLRAAPAPAAIFEESASEQENVLESDAAEDSAADTAAMAVVEAPTWRSRLDEVEQRIKKGQESTETPSTSNSLKNQAAMELNLWESELNSLYSQILEQLDEEQAKKLAQQQREWMKFRDSSAAAAAKNSPGGAESVEYIASLAKTTRERAYALLDLYEKELDL